MFSADRSEIRRMYAETWRKACRGQPLSPLESRIASVIHEHPEYHGVVENADAALEADFPPEAGQTNPFLHMGLHIAVREQVAIDRPVGVRRIFEELTAHREEHYAEHAMLECLAETLWEAQRDAREPDNGTYLKRLRALVAQGSNLG